MALKLKTGKSITDTFGNVYTNAYGVVDQCNGNKKDKQQVIVFEVYRSQTDRQNNVLPFTQATHIIKGDNFDTFFSAQAITDDHNQYAQSYAYLLQLVDQDNNLVYTDWENEI